jgi:hypothetical protein
VIESRRDASVARVVLFKKVAHAPTEQAGCAGQAQMHFRSELNRKVNPGWWFGVENNDKTPIGGRYFAFHPAAEGPVPKPFKKSHAALELIEDGAVVGLGLF